MIYLSGVVKPEIAGRVGFFLQPGNRLRPPNGAVWAADNGCYSQGDRFSEARWLRWLEVLKPHQDRCLFAVAPDVVGNAEATWRRSEPTLATISALGYRPALAAQDGFDPNGIDWSLFGCLFIGGTTSWKLSPAARAAALEAIRRGKAVHMGRVNSLRRLQAAALMGCDSADGTFLRPAPDQNVPRLLNWLRRLEAEPFLPLN